jgi:glucokinase
MKLKNYGKISNMTDKNDFLLGIDIGGSITKLLLVKDFKIVGRIKIKTSKENRKDFLSQLGEAIDEIILAAEGNKIKGVGCGVAGMLDLERGVVLKAPNIPILNGFNIKNWISKKTGIEIRVDNDARSFTRAEHLWGAGKRYKNMVGITLGTGVGGGIIIDGKLVYGNNGSAGEVGHMILNAKGEDLEMLTMKYMSDSGFPVVVEAYNNKKAKEALKNFENNLAMGFTNIITILNPEAIIIGGGASEAGKFFIPKIKKIISGKNIKILLSKLGEDAGALGAAGLFYEG